MPDNLLNTTLMNVIGIDIGGTTLSAAIFSPDGKFRHRENTPLDGRTGKDVGLLIIRHVDRLMTANGGAIDAVGVSVPGIYYPDIGTVWAPNIPGWEQYSLQEEIRTALSSEYIIITVESDRACYIAGETWQGNARGYKDAVFIAVGTGIGAGIMVNGEILHGTGGSAGSVGWLALKQPFRDEYKRCGCLEYDASGEGIARKTREVLANEPSYSGMLKNMESSALTAKDVFEAFCLKDSLATKVIDNCIHLWGMAAANIISLLNPEIIVFGGEVFGPASELIDRIRLEAMKWAQPAAGRQAIFAVSALGENAGLFGAAWCALQRLN